MFHHAIHYLCLIVVLYCASVPRDAAAETITLDLPFVSVVEFINYSFQTNVTSQSRGWAWGPSYLSTGTVYFITLKNYVPEEELIFEASMGQVGSERNTFEVRNIGANKTTVSVIRRVQLFISSRERDSEKGLLEVFQKDIKAWLEGAEDAPVESQGEEADGGDLQALKNIYDATMQRSFRYS